MTRFRTLTDGLIFGEGPRWHAGRLWYSDMHDRKIWSIDETGNKRVELETEDDPSGLGFLPDGRLLFVSMTRRRLMIYDGERIQEFADLSALASFHCNDMVTDLKGRSWVGNFGFDLHGGASLKPANLIRVDPDGTIHLAAEDLLFPNGTVITPDGKTMVVAETFGSRLTSFTIEADGTLGNRSLWADIAPAVPDGICLDAEGAIWVASPSTQEVLRVFEGGEISERHKVSTNAFACMLGGEDGKSLFVLTSEESNPHVLQGKRTGKVEIMQTSGPRAGLP